MQSFQQQEIFCQECGAANMLGASICSACQQALVPAKATKTTSAGSPSPGKVPVVLRVAPQSALQPGSAELFHERYRVLNEVGRGGFGAVYRARDCQRRNRLVAIKQIDLSQLTPQQIIEATDSFNREIHMLSRLKHRGLPKIIEHFTANNCWYVVMEYIQGQTLEELLKRSRSGYLSLDKTLKIGQDLVEVLDYLHNNKPPIIFRDVKPANIMLTRANRVYLIDFGIARLFAPGRKRDTGALGSPGYAAPEQYGQAQTDERTDIYGLGATLQTLLTGRDPLELSSGQSPRNPRSLPGELQTLLNSMLATDPHQRPPRMTGIGSRLGKCYSPWHAIRSFGKGLACGALFLAWAALGLFLDALANNHQIGSSQLHGLIFALNCLLPIAGFSTAIWQIINLLNGHKRWFATGLLLVLLIVLLLAWVINSMLIQW